MDEPICTICFRRIKPDQGRKKCTRSFYAHTRCVSAAEALYLQQSEQEIERIEEAYAQLEEGFRVLSQSLLREKLQLEQALTELMEVFQSAIQGGDAPDLGGVVNIVSHKGSYYESHNS